MRRYASMVVLLGAAGLVGAFVPGVTLVALLVALIGLGLGVFGLIIDRSFNMRALGGTILSSAAVSASIIMGLVYGF